MSKLAYYNLTYKGLSYSRQLTLHLCPRKYEILAKTKANMFEDCVTFAYGSCVGRGIQSILEGKSIDRVIWDAICAYDYDIFAELTANEIDSKKSIFWAIDGLQKLHLLLNSPASPLADWEVACVLTHNSEVKAAVELAFVVLGNDGYTYEGHIDLVLQHKKTKALAVLEIKTDGTQLIEPAKYENSNQALGYSMIVEQIANDQKIPVPTTFQVFYFVYGTRKQQYEVFTFTKPMSVRHRWILGLASDFNYIEQCEVDYGYQMRGQSCFHFFKKCKALGRCTLSNDSLSLDNAANVFSDKLQPDFTYELSALIETAGSNLVDVRSING